MSILDVLLKNKDNNYIILGHEVPDVDSIVTGILLERFIIKYTNSNAEFKIPDKIDDETISVFNYFGIDISGYQKPIDLNDTNFILVDHCEDNRIDKALMVLDHHPSNPSTKKEEAMYFKNVMSSSTSTLLVKGNEQYFNKEDFFLCLLGLYLDTASFNSTKVVEDDRKWALDMIEKYGFNEKELYKIGLCLTDIDSMGINSIMLNGLRKYNYKGNLIESSYIQVEEISVCKLNQILNDLYVYLNNNSLNYFVFIVHDMKNMKTTTYTISKEGIVIDEHDRYTSRGSNIIPDLFNKIDSSNHTLKYKK